MVSRNPCNEPLSKVLKHVVTKGSDDDGNPLTDEEDGWESDNHSSEADL